MIYSKCLKVNHDLISKLLTILERKIILSEVIR